MQKCRVLVLAVIAVSALLIAACAKEPAPAGSGGTGGPAGGRGTGGATGTGGTRVATSQDASIATGHDAKEYASLDGPSGCGLASAPTGVLANQTITVGERVRTYLLSVPRSYDPSTPLALVFAWHGNGGTGNYVRQAYALEPAAAGGAIFVYPDGIASAGWDPSPTGLDVALFDALLDFLTNSYCIDRNRIFSTGVSAGGYFSNLLGNCRGNVLRAIAPVAGGLVGAGSGAGKVGAWIAHASNDDMVGFTNGEATRDWWASQNGCSTTLEKVPVSPSGCVEYQGCLPDLPVVWCVYTEGHAWPSIANCYDGGVCFDAGPAIWAFFARFK